MYSLLIKDRSYPISVYMTYMMRVKGFTRTEAVDLMTMAAVRMGLRKSTASPANNTVAEWGRSIDAPLWSVITAMMILEQFGKIPFTEQEWAFWAYAAAERGQDKANYNGKWLYWLLKAERYKSWHDKRGLVRKEFEGLTYPNTAMKIMLLFRGNGIQSLTIAELFANLDDSELTMQTLTQRITSDESFCDSDMSLAIKLSEQSKEIHDNISLTLHELNLNGAIHYRSGGNIVVT